jgi:hypothetical protein
VGGGGGSVDINCTMMEVLEGLWNAFVLPHTTVRLRKARWRNMESARKGAVNYR